MQLVEAVRQRIINLCYEREITIHKLALISGISSSTLFSIFNGKSINPSLTTILHICEGLDIDLATFFDDPLFEDIYNE